MRADGGYLRGPWWAYQGEDPYDIRRCFVIAWGRIVKQPHEMFQDMRCIQFVIKTGRGAGREEKHLVCEGTGEHISTVVMRAMDKNDAVLCAGTWVEKRNVKTKKGIKSMYKMEVHFIVPMGLVGFALDLYCLPELQKMVEQYKNEAADPWESDN